MGATVTAALLPSTTSKPSTVTAIESTPVPKRVTNSCDDIRAEMKKTSTTTNRDHNLNSIKQQLKKYAEEVSSIRVVKKTSSVMSNSMMRTRRKRAEAAATPTSKSKRREANLASYLHIQSLLGWDTQLKEYIENPNVLSKVKTILNSTILLILMFIKFIKQKLN